MWRKDPDFDKFSFWAFALSWIAAIVAAIIGLIDKGQLAFDDPRQATINQHITFSIVFIIISGLIAYERFRQSDILESKRRWWYLGLIAVGAGVVTIAGWLGGELVYNLQIGVR